MSANFYSGGKTTVKQLPQKLQTLLSTGRVTVTFHQTQFLLSILDYQITETPVICVDEESGKLIFREVINLTLYCGEEPTSENNN